MKSDMILEKMLDKDLPEQPTTNVEDKMTEEIKNLETRLNNSMEKKFAEITTKLEGIKSEGANAAGSTGDKPMEKTDENTKTLTGEAGGENNE